MWHIFDRYKGVVWPKARQMNLIARILNNLCAGAGITIDTPADPGPSAPVTISVDTEWFEDKIGSGGGGGGGGGGGMFAWDSATKTMMPGGFMLGRTWVSVSSGTGSNMGDGIYHLKVTLSSGSATGEVVTLNSVGAAASGNISYIPIYKIVDGKISEDYRGGFVVPVWET